MQAGSEVEGAGRKGSKKGKGRGGREGGKEGGKEVEKDSDSTAAQQVFVRVRANASLLYVSVVQSPLGNVGVIILYLSVWLRL